MLKRIIVHLGVLLTVGLLVAVVSVSADEDASSQRVFVPAVHYQSTPCHATVNPGQSIQAAINASQSGQTICVRAGTYREQVVIRPSKSGITVMAYPGERPVIDGEHRRPESEYAGLVHITGSRIVFDGFEVRNSARLGLVVYQPNPTSPPLEDVIVRNSTIAGSMKSGIIVTGMNDVYPRNVVIENNIVHSNVMQNLTGTGPGTAVGFVKVVNSVARGNHIFHNHGEGLVSDRWAAHTTFEDNVLYDNKKVSLYLNNTQYPLVQRNLVFCTDDRDYWGGPPDRRDAGAGFHLRDEDYSSLGTVPPRSTGQVIINNIIVGCGHNFVIDSYVPGGGLNNALVANNTFVNVRGDNYHYVGNVILSGAASYNNSRFLNNLILQATPGTIAAVLTTHATPDLSTFSLAHNLYSKATHPNHIWPTNEPGRLIADPMLINPVWPTKGTMPNPANYGLRAGSPAINAGVPLQVVTTDFFGRPRSGAPDIGAIEFSP